jgi:hypothetical protein
MAGQCRSLRRLHRCNGFEFYLSWFSRLWTHTAAETRLKAEQAYDQLLQNNSALRGDAVLDLRLQESGDVLSSSSVTAELVLS